MGKSEPYSHKETDFTRSVGRDYAFEQILEKLEKSGAEISQDETTPLYSDMGTTEIEIGTQREIIFNLNGFDFRLIRDVQSVKINRSNRVYSSEELETPMVRIKLWKKAEIEDDWIAVDIDMLI